MAMEKNGDAVRLSSTVCVAFMVLSKGLGTTIAIVPGKE